MTAVLTELSENKRRASSQETENSLERWHRKPEPLSDARSPILAGEVFRGQVTMARCAREHTLDIQSWC